MIDTANSIADAWTRLGFLSQADLDVTGTWVTSTELYEWADELAQMLAYKCGVFVNLDTSVTVTAGTALYTEPASNVYTLAAWLGTTNLRLTPVRELWALDNVWSATSGPATRASLDASGAGTITLYPNPTAGGTLSQLAEEYPATIASGSSTVALPTVLQDAFTYAQLAGAKSKESDATDAGAAAHYQARVDLYVAICDFLYGKG
jgi:hypothetical protein